MYALAIIAVGLYFILLIGVGYVVGKFIKELFDSKALEKKINKMTEDFTAFEIEMNDNLNDLEEEYQKLDGKYKVHLNEMKKEMDEMEDDVKEIFDYAQKLTDLNNCLYDRIAVIHSVLDKNPTPEQIEELRKTIQNDIEERKEYQNELKKYEQERRQRIKGSFNQGMTR